MSVRRQQDYWFAQLRRMLWLHREALAGRYPNGSNAAAALGVSVKTVQRDVRAMAEMGLNLKYDELRWGFFYEDAPGDPIEWFVRALIGPLPEPVESLEERKQTWLIKRAPRSPRAVVRRYPFLALRPEPMAECEKARRLRNLVGEYDPAKSAAEFLEQYLKTKTKEENE